VYLYSLESHRGAHHLGDVGPLDAAGDEVGLEGAHVEQARHGVDGGHHALWGGENSNRISRFVLKGLLLDYIQGTSKKTGRADSTYALGNSL